MSKIIPEQSNFIAIGAWNPAIIQPHWLKKQFGERIPDECGVEIVSAGGLISAFRLNYKRIVIDPNNGRLVLIPKEDNKEIYQYLSEIALGIQDKLSHTPIIAAGSNFVFKLESNESFTIDEIEKEPDILKLYDNTHEKDKIISKSIRHTFGHDNYTINIIYESTKAEKLLKINFDYQKQSPMKRAAELLVKNYEYALELNAHLVRK